MTFGSQHILDDVHIPFITGTKSQREYDEASYTRVVMRESRNSVHIIPFRFGGEMRREAAYRADLIGRIEERFPGCLILPTDPSRRQGICDIVILFRRRWAMLELKRSATADHRPNQDYYVDQFNEMSFAAFIYPENEEDVLDDLQSALGV